MGSGQNNPKAVGNIQILQPDGASKPIAGAESGNVRAVSWSGYHWLKTKIHSCYHCILNENECPAYEENSDCRIISDYIDQRMKAFTEQEVAQEQVDTFRLVLHLNVMVFLAEIYTGKEGMFVKGKDGLHYFHPLYNRLSTYIETRRRNLESLNQKIMPGGFNFGDMIQEVTKEEANDKSNK